MSGQTIGARLAAAQARADAARAQLGSTVSQLKQRVSPQALAQEAADGLKDKGLTVARDVAQAVARKPGTATAVVGGLALFLLRHRLIALARGATGTAAGSLTPEPEPTKPESAKGPAR